MLWVTPHFNPIFKIWTESPEKQKFSLIISTTYSLSQNSLAHILPHLNVFFLDVNVSLTSNEDKNADFYTKRMDKHQDLLYSSYHPHHTKNAIPSSLAFRLRRTCSTDKTFNTRATGLPTQLLPIRQETSEPWLIYCKIPKRNLEPRIFNSFGNFKNSKTKPPKRNLRRRVQAPKRNDRVTRKLCGGVSVCSSCTKLLILDFAKLAKKLNVT